MMSNNISFKRLIRKYEYLQEELDFIEEELSLMDGEFKNLIINSGYTFKSSDKKSISGETTTEINPNLPQKYKKLFRKMVVKCHPDKLNKEEDNSELIDIYDKVINAQEQGDLGKLVMLAIKLDVDVKDFESDVEIIKNSCDKLNQQIITHTNSSIWYWYNLKTDEEKDSFIEKYIKTALSKNLIFKK
jgi:hypothetical protein